jgi:hypothetical protein
LHCIIPNFEGIGDEVKGWDIDLLAPFDWPKLIPYG